MPNYYGQRGDDFLLWLPFLEQKTPGYFVEVGALDGRRFSNTYSFEEQGWTGICVEAHPDYIDIIKKNRPNSKVVFAAAGDENTTVTFYTNNRGSLSTLDPSQEEQFKAYGAYFTGFIEREVPMMTLSCILDDEQAPEIIDILSIDVEGAEMRVLQGMDWARYTVQVVVIEAGNTEVEAQLDSFFAQHDYHKARNYFGNIFYCKNEAIARIIGATAVNCTVTQTPHPLDEVQQPRQFQVVNSQLILPQNEAGTTGEHASMSWAKKLRYYGKRLLKGIAQVGSSKTDNAAASNRLSQVFELGFHGDRYLLDLVDHLLQQSTAFIETGTNVGTTTHFVASNYAKLQVYSCEPDETAFAKATETTATDTNVHLYQQLSPEFLYKLHIEKPELLQTLNLYWLDAHDYGFKWPLHDEIRYITDTMPQAFILVDDTKVPGLESAFRYCTYEEQECNLDYIKNALAPGKSYRIFYPAYTEHTSKHHPLIGTMGVIHGSIAVDENIFKHFTVIDITT